MKSPTPAHSADSLRTLLADVLDAHDCDQLEYVERDGSTEPTERFSEIIRRIRAALASPVGADVASDERALFETYFCMTLSCDDSESQELIDAARSAAHDAWMHRAALTVAPAQPVLTQQEPVGEVITDRSYGHLIKWRNGFNPGVGTKLYVHPSPVSGAAEELTEVARPDLAKLRKAFRTTVTGGGSNPREYAMIFRFEKIADMHAADDEWRAFAALFAAPSPTGDTK